METAARRSVWISAVGLTVLVVTAGTVSAGNLDPPGVPAPTMKTLDQVEPRTFISALPATISSSGSYYLTGDLSLAATDTNGITISASNVTLDLRGFSIAGPGSGTGNGILVSNVRGTIRTGISIYNGSINSWGAAGISAGSTTDSQFANLRVSGNNGIGVHLGMQCRLSDSIVTDNGSIGITVDQGTTISGCVAAGNAADGIRTQANATILGCSVRGNLVGIFAGQSNVIRDTTADANTGTGIFAAVGSVISHSAAKSNGVDGIGIGDVGTIIACTVQGNGRDGISAADKATITDCISSQNTSDGIVAGSAVVRGSSAYNNTGGDGIRVGPGSTVTGCTSRNNNGDGIVTGFGSTVSGCTAKENVGDGIQVPQDSYVTQNDCTQNGNAGTGAGIHTIGADNRIEANNVTDNDFGILVDAAGNLVIKNSASGNGTPATDNYSITGTNTTGAIVTATGVIAADPWANFSY